MARAFLPAPWPLIIGALLCISGCASGRDLNWEPHSASVSPPSSSFRTLTWLQGDAASDQEGENADHPHELSRSRQTNEVRPRRHLNDLAGSGNREATVSEASSRSDASLGPDLDKVGAANEGLTPVPPVRHQLAEDTFYGFQLNGLQYDGGPVASGGVNIYLIWYGNWTEYTATQTLIRNFLDSLGPNSTAPKVPSVEGWWAVATEYYSSGPGAARVLPNITLKGEVDASDLPAGTFINETGVVTILNTSLAAGLPADNQGFYFVLSTPKPDDCSAEACALRSTQWFPQYPTVNFTHSWVKYPNASCLSSCTPYQEGGKYVSPNGDEAGDGMVNLMSAMLAGMAISPQLNGWNILNGGEFASDAGMLCLFNYSRTATNADGGTFNVYGNRNQTFLLSQFYDVSRGQCALQGADFKATLASPPPPVVRPPPPARTPPPPPRPSPPSTSSPSGNGSLPGTNAPAPVAQPPAGSPSNETSASLASPSGGSSSSSTSGTLAILVGVGVSLAAIVLVALLLLLWRRHQRTKRGVNGMVALPKIAPGPPPPPSKQEPPHSPLGAMAGAPGGNIIQLPGGHWIQSFTLAEVEAATDHFSVDNRLGKGGYGTVYKGKGPDGSLWAVKRSHMRTEEGAVDPEFEHEIHMIAPMSHRHLVGLKGFCREKTEQILVYELVPNGTLKQHLHADPKEGVPPLSFAQRLDIGIGAARGLHYLHSFAQDPVIHRDVKSENILLDAHMQAKVADFGLLKPLADVEATHVSTRVAGTIGYMDPEYRELSQVTTRSDVYSFGVVLMELVTGKKPVVPANEITGSGVVTNEMVTLVRWVNRHVAIGQIEALVDPSLKTDYNLEAVKKIIHLARLCTQDVGDLRPSMEEVVRRLEDIKAEARGEYGGGTDWMRTVAEPKGGNRTKFSLSSLMSDTFTDSISSRPAAR